MKLNLRKLTKFIKLNNGRNYKGHITFYHRGGGCKKRYRFINLNYFFFGLKFIIYSINYDPFRSSYIMLNLYQNGIFLYNLSFDEAKIGLILESGNTSSFNFGNVLTLNFIPIGSLIYNIEIFPKKGGKISRSAGNFSVILSKFTYEKNLILLRFFSNNEYLLNKDCKATMGIVSNKNHYLKKLYKAGQSRWLGIRPYVRGVAKNPIDHPHGGDTSGGCPSVDMFGNLSKGKPTRKKKNKNNNKLILKFRVKKK